MVLTATLLALAATTSSAALLWDGRANEYSSASFLNDWSWSNQVGPYQYYIHGPSPLSSYVNMSPAYANPADTVSEQGFQITIDSTSYWNGQNMRRTELIPQTSAGINKGKVFYHFSVQYDGSVNPPDAGYEHQVCFFESHFTEMKFGLMSGEQGTSNGDLQWFVGGKKVWSVNWEAGVWHNIAYGIDFDAGSVTFYHSTGGDALVKTAGPVSATTFSDGKDWHLGVLRLPSNSGSTGGPTEDWHFSGVYIEDGNLTTSVTGLAGPSQAFKRRTGRVTH